MARFIIAILIGFSVPAMGAPIDSGNVSVIDGDTIRVQHKQPDVRLVGFNAPETRNAVCKAEEEQGAKATRRLRDLVGAGNLDFTFVACNCPAGTEGTPSCNYGRRCGTLKAGGRDVGSILIGEGLGGFLMSELQQMPKPGNHVVWAGWRFEVVDMDGRRIDMVLVQRAPEG